MYIYTWRHAYLSGCCSEPLENLSCLEWPNLKTIESRQFRVTVNPLTLTP